MIRIHQIKLTPGQGEEKLRAKAAAILKIKESEIRSLKVVKRSLDARRKPELFYSYVVDVQVPEQEKIFKRCSRSAGQHNISIETPKEYCFPKERGNRAIRRPVIAGMGPAGLFCGFFLAQAGFAPLLLERGKDVEARQRDVEAFWAGGSLQPESNVQFGEGGAGTFSDGKLNTLVKDKYGRNREVLKLLVAFGAPEEILYESKPHIGTDILRDVVKRMRQAIISLGGEVRFESQVTDIRLGADGRLQRIVINDSRELAADVLVLAIGHSARNTFEMLHQRQVPMEAKPFAVGFRVEHRQSMINESQYGRDATSELPAAPYKVAAKTKDGRGVYSFCMCPGGYVVNASSEPGRLCVNGMSYSGRSGDNANSAIIVTVSPEDFGEDHPLSGMAFQRKLEENAWQAGEGKVPVQTYGSFKACVEGTEKTTEPEACAESNQQKPVPAIKGQYVYADITGILPRVLNQGIVDGMEQFGREIRGFNRPDTLLSGVESRTSSPVRILRDETLQSAVAGLYPCGEGAGYAGGITSAAMDGIKVAEAIATACHLSEKEESRLPKSQSDIDGCQKIQ